MKQNYQIITFFNDDFENATVEESFLTWNEAQKISITIISIEIFMNQQPLEKLVIFIHIGQKSFHIQFF